MNTLTIHNITLGAGVPKIIVPIVDRTEETILRRTEDFAGKKIDLVEWRADYFDQVDDLQAVARVLKQLKERLPDQVLLFTFRTEREGGERSISPEDYLTLNRCAAESGFADLIDVEIFSENAREIIALIHQAGKKVVGSNHDFSATPAQSEIVARLCKMQEMGADLPKIAVMAQSPLDVLTLLSATEEMHRSYADRPIITMSMSGLGSISRMAGEIFGSCATFGTVHQSSAPGQISADELEQVLECVHRANT